MTGNHSNEIRIRNINGSDLVEGKSYIFKALAAINEIYIRKNPELFAAIGYSSCFQGVYGSMERRKQIIYVPHAVHSVLLYYVIPDYTM